MDHDMMASMDSDAVLEPNVAIPIASTHEVALPRLWCSKKEIISTQYSIAF
jgi:hypothetical protein